LEDWVLWEVLLERLGMAGNSWNKLATNITFASEFPCKDLKVRPIACYSTETISLHVINFLQRILCAFLSIFSARISRLASFRGDKSHKPGATWFNNKQYFTESYGQ
jgi:hypothetical protein